jgi:hypothetical protein
MTLHPLDLALAARGFRTGGKLLGMHELPWSAVLDRRSPIVVVLEDALREILGMPDVEVACGLASQDVNVEGHVE